MAISNYQEAVKMAIAILQSTLEDSAAEESAKHKDDAPVEMMTIKECVQKFPGLSEHTIRKLITQDKIRHIRTGEGERGKILIPKTAIIEYLKITA